MWGRRCHRAKDMVLRRVGVDLSVVWAGEHGNRCRHCREPILKYGNRFRQRSIRAKAWRHVKNRSERGAAFGAMILPQKQLQEL